MPDNNLLGYFFKVVKSEKLDIAKLKTNDSLRKEVSELILFGFKRNIAPQEVAAWINQKLSEG